MIIDFYKGNGGGGGGGDVTKAEVKRMISSALTEYSEDIEAGDPIVGLAKNLYSPDGVTNQDTFIMRTTAGEDSVSTGVAYLKQVKGRTIATEPVYAGVYGTFVPTDRFTVAYTGSSETVGSSAYTYSNGEWDKDVTDFVITGLLLDGDEFTHTINELTYYQLRTTVDATYDGSIDSNVGDSYAFKYNSSSDVWDLVDSEDITITSDVDLSEYGITINTGATLENNDKIFLDAEDDFVNSYEYNRVTRVNPTISINSETYEAEAGETGTTVFSYDGSDWTPGLTAYGITVTGDIYDGDGISVLYTGSIYTPMQDTTPTSFTALGLNSFDKDNPTTKVIDGVTYYIVKAVGGLADGYVIYGGSGATITGGVADSANASAITTTTGATTLVVNPTTGATYIYFTTTGSIDDVCVHPQWSGYMNEAYEAYSESTVVLPTKDTNGHALPALISVGNVGNIMDLDNGIFTQYVESIPATEELIQQYRTGKTWGVDYVFDSNHIYQVLDTPVEIEMEETINAYNENDFSVEYFNGTNVAVPAVCYYMTNLVDKLRRDVLTKSNVVECTQEEYNSMDHDPDTAYIITDAETVDMDSIITHVDSLPSAATPGVVYEYNGQLVKYVDGAGNWGRWTGNSYAATLHYTKFPESDSPILLATYGYASNRNRYVVYDGEADKIKIYDNNSYTGTPLYTINKGTKNNKIETQYTWCYYSDFGWYDNIVFFQGRVDNVGITTASTSTNTGYYEFVNQLGQVKSFLSSGTGQPLWDEDGRIVGKARDINSAYIQINPSGEYNNAIYVFCNQNGGQLFRAFAPTVGGTTGQVLKSNGTWAAPTWADFYTTYTAGVHFWKGSQDAYDAIVTKDANTLYIIIPD